MEHFAQTEIAQSIKAKETLAGQETLKISVCKNKKNQCIQTIFHPRSRGTYHLISMGTRDGGGKRRLYKHKRHCLSCICCCHHSFHTYTDTCTRSLIWCSSHGCGQLMLTLVACFSLSHESVFGSDANATTPPPSANATPTPTGIHYQPEGVQLLW